MDLLLCARSHTSWAAGMEPLAALAGSCSVTGWLRPSVYSRCSREEAGRFGVFVCLCLCGWPLTCASVHNYTWVYIRRFIGCSVYYCLCYLVSDSYDGLQKVSYFGGGGGSTDLHTALLGETPSNTFVMNWSAICKPGLIVRHRRLISLMLLWLNGKCIPAARFRDLMEKQIKSITHGCT